MNRTQIEWVKNPDGTQGYTWNPITGCLNQDKGICKGGGFPCYAYKLAHGRVRQRYLSNTDVGGAGFLSLHNKDPFYPRFWDSRLYHAWGGKAKGIFTCDMSDLFGVGVPDIWTQTVLDLCRLHNENRYYLLTKQPQNLKRFSPFPDNCWVGVTVTASGFAPVAYHHLSAIRAKTKYISFEPLMGQIGTDELKNLATVSDWWIIGAQTKPLKLPNLNWVREIVEAADRAEIPVFHKDNLEPLWTLENRNKPSFKFSRPSPGATEIGLLRQELPKVI